MQTFNRGDARALASFWTPEGDLVDLEGHHLKGRKAIEEAYRKTFADAKGARLFIRINSLRVVRPDLALTQLEHVLELNPNHAEARRLREASRKEIAAKRAG